MTFTQVIAPTQAILRRPPRPRAWHADLARTLESWIEAEAQGSGRLGSPSLDGNRSRGLRLVADAFYRGPIARRIDAWSTAHGGLIRYVDLATHTTRIEEPVAVDYRGSDHLQVRLHGRKAPTCSKRCKSSKAIDLKAMGHNSP